MTFGQDIAGAFLEAGDAVVELGAFADAIDELIDAAVAAGATPRLRRCVRQAIEARASLARAAGVSHPGTEIPMVGRIGRVGGRS